MLHYKSWVGTPFTPLQVPVGAQKASSKSAGLDPLHIYIIHNSNEITFVKYLGVTTPWGTTLKQHSLRKVATSALSSLVTSREPQSPAKQQQEKCRAWDSISVLSEWCQTTGWACVISLSSSTVLSKRSSLLTAACCCFNLSLYSSNSCRLRTGGSFYSKTIINEE